jgi:predicted TIM-barrel fold metal-dependent hydrolase
MSDRRQFLKNVTGATAGLYFVGCGFANSFASVQVDGGRKRREVTVGGRRMLTVDVHAHCQTPEAGQLLKSINSNQPSDPGETEDIIRMLNLHNVNERLAQMDARGIDMAVLSANPHWYRADRDLASQVVRIQNEKLAEACAAHPDRFVGLAAVALQYPDLAAEQLEDGVKELGMRGTLIAGSINGDELSNPKFHPFWAKAEELGAVVFIHPIYFAEGHTRFQGNGWLDNIIGNPLETTTALLHLIFEGTLDRFPKLKILAAHAGGFLPSYVGRADRCGNALVHPELCKPVKKLPSEYLKQIYYDTLIFTDEGLRHLIAEVGSSQILLGTDAPGDWHPEAVDFILHAKGLSDADRRAILGESAKKLFRIT